MTVQELQDMVTSATSDMPEGSSAAIEIRNEDWRTVRDELIAMPISAAVYPDVIGYVDDGRIANFMGVPVYAGKNKTAIVLRGDAASVNNCRRVEV